MVFPTITMFPGRFGGLGVLNYCVTGAGIHGPASAVLSGSVARLAVAHLNPASSCRCDDTSRHLLPDALNSKVRNA